MPRHIVTVGLDLDLLRGLRRLSSGRPHSTVLRELAVQAVRRGAPSIRAFHLQEAESISRVSVSVDADLAVALRRRFGTTSLADCIRGILAHQLRHGDLCPGSAEEAGPASRGPGGFGGRADDHRADRSEPHAADENAWEIHRFGQSPRTDGELRSTATIREARIVEHPHVESSEGDLCELIFDQTPLSRRRPRLVTVQNLLEGGPHDSLLHGLGRKDEVGILIGVGVDARSYTAMLMPDANEQLAELERLWHRTRRGMTVHVTVTLFLFDSDEPSCILLVVLRTV